MQQNTVEQLTVDDKKLANGFGYLTGYYFHLLDDDGKVIQQGRIMRYLEQGYYVVTFFEWGFGRMGDHVIMRISDIVNGKAWIYPESEHEDFLNIGLRSFD